MFIGLLFTYNISFPCSLLQLSCTSGFFKIPFHEGQIFKNDAYKPDIFQKSFIKQYVNKQYVHLYAFLEYVCVLIIILSVVEGM